VECANGAADEEPQGAAQSEAFLKVASLRSVLSSFAPRYSFFIILSEQIWIDLPAANKLETPEIVLIGDEDCVIDSGDGVVSEGVKRTKIVDSRMKDSILQSHLVVSTVELSKTGVVCVNKIPSTFQTCIIYVRSGAWRASEL